MCDTNAQAAVTARTHTSTKMSDAVLNSNMVGLGDGDAIGEVVGAEVGEVIAVDVLITDTEPLSRFVT